MVVSDLPPFSVMLWEQHFYAVIANTIGRGVTKELTQKKEAPKVLSILSVAR